MVESSEAIERTSTAMRALLAVAGGLVLIIGIPLYLVPQNSEEYFSWSVTPLSAAFLGGAYLSAAVIEFAAARERIWANARIAVPAVLVFTSLTLLVTLGNIDQYHFKAPGFVQSVGTWAWLVVYVVVPPIMALVLLVQLLRRGSDPERDRPLPTSLRAGLTTGGIVLFAGGVMLLLSPTSADWLWPWPVSELTGRAFGAWMVGFAIAMACRAGSTVGSPLSSLCSFAAVSTSSKRLRSLLEPAPSVPIPTATPAPLIDGTGATPAAIFMFDWGQWTTPTPRSASSSISSGVGKITWAATSRSSRRPKCSR